MAADIYLAMTAAEISSAPFLPHKIAWMACFFSPCGQGLSNLPSVLPAESLLILNDSLPFRGHDLHRIAEQLGSSVESLHCSGVLLDFQMPENRELSDLAAHLVSTLPCPVAVSDSYAKALSCPVFLSPCPHHMPLPKHIAPWSGRELWLDLAVDAEMLTLNSEGATVLPLPPGEIPDGGYRDEELHCHYSIVTAEDSARFTLWRTREDLESLFQEAENIGIHRLVGLYQELRNTNAGKHPSL